MNPEGVGRLFAASLNDGPFPEHYEAIEAPVDNFLARQEGGTNPVTKQFSSDKDVYGKREDFPIVCTTYRLTEHFHYWTQHNVRLNMLQPDFFFEIPEEMAKEKGIANGSKVKVSSARGSIEGVAMVTKRLKPLKIDGKDVWQIGFPIHWGFAGDAGHTGPLANILTPVGHGPEHLDARSTRRSSSSSRRREGGGHERSKPRDRPLVRSGLGQPLRPAHRPHRLEVHRHDHLHRLQGLRGRLPGVERPAAGRDAAGGDYQTLPTLDAEFWNLIRFNERDVDGGIAWLMRKDQCMHCEEPGCLEACPAPGAIVQYANGIVDVNPDQCIGCGYCETGCPFDVPRFSQTTGKMAKCTLCVDRVSVGLEPACIKACPTGCLHFGTKDDMLALGAHPGRAAEGQRIPACRGLRPGRRERHERRHGARPRRPSGSGTACRPIRTFPWGVKFWKKVLRPLGVLAIFGAVIGAFAHYTKYGPKEVRGADDPNSNLPDAWLEGGTT